LKETEIDGGTDGSYLGQHYFRCCEERAVFVHPRHCRADARFNAAAASGGRANLSHPQEMGK